MPRNGWELARCRTTIRSFFLSPTGSSPCRPLTPGFKPVEALEWQDAEDFGLDDLCVDLGCKTDPAEDERLPKMGRVLVISDSNSEEIVWYVAPETVREAIRVFKAEGRSDETVGPPGLR